MKMFRYEIIWEKSKSNGFTMANYRPLKNHENICVFSKSPANYTSKNIAMKYNPQGLELLKKTKEKINTKKRNTTTFFGNNFKNDSFESKNKNFPKSIVKIDNEVDKFHPTQKPVALFEYLIKTYTNEGDVVLDNCMGSGTTAIACMNTNRHYIGFELDSGYFNKTMERINNHSLPLMSDMQSDIAA